MPEDPDETERRKINCFLISVLFSSVPLDADVSWALYDAACDLIQAGAGEARLHSEVVSGTIQSGEHVALGTLAGPSFAAAISTPSHKEAQVRFFVTRDGLEFHRRQQPRPRANRLN